MVIRSGRDCLLLLTLSALLPLVAAEVRLDLPDPLVPGVVLEGALVVTNAEAHVNQVELPEVPGLEWRTHGTSSQISITNGKKSSVETISLNLRVQSTDPFAIPAITVHFTDGSTLATQPVTARPQAANANLNGEAYAEATFEPDSIVPGESSTLIFRVFLRQDRRRAIEEPGLSPPTGTLELGKRSDSKGVTTDAQGRRWSVSTYRWALTAAQSGTYEASGQQTWFRCKEDIFGSLVAESKHQTPIKAATLTVQTLPNAGRPDDFTGLVGAISARATLERARIASGEGTALEVVVNGRQTELLARPRLSLPAGMQAYPKEDAAVATPGERHFRWDVVPSVAGEFTLPALSFPFFDPATRSYRRAETAPLTLTVLPGRARELVVSGAPLPVAQAPTTTRQAAPTLPAPLRGQAVTAPTGAAWLAFLAALGLGAASGLAQRWWSRTPRIPHRGQALARAIAAKDLAAIAQALASLRPALGDDARRQAADTLLQAVDAARFGGGQLNEDVIRLAHDLTGVA